jgi:hypothetical protein
MEALGNQSAKVGRIRKVGTIIGKNTKVEIDADLYTGMLIGSKPGAEK